MENKQFTDCALISSQKLRPKIVFWKLVLVRTIGKQIIIHNSEIVQGENSECSCEHGWGVGKGNTD